MSNLDDRRAYERKVAARRKAHRGRPEVTLFVASDETTGTLSAEMLAWEMHPLELIACIGRMIDRLDTVAPAAKSPDRVRAAAAALRGTFNQTFRVTESGSGPVQ